MNQSRELLHLGCGRSDTGRADALSNGTPLSIIQRLRLRLRLGERCVCDLTDALDAAQSRLSFHLKVLKDAELVSDRRDCRSIHYT